VQQEAHQLIEEFMLLANMSVARLIADAFPGRAMLRWAMRGGSTQGVHGQVLLWFCFRAFGVMDRCCWTT
jgi:hypothetical protein